MVQNWEINIYQRYFDLLFEYISAYSYILCVLRILLAHTLCNDYFSYLILICFRLLTSHQILASHQVKRVLKLGGKFICLTLAESHVLGIVCV